MHAHMYENSTWTDTKHMYSSIKHLTNQLYKRILPVNFTRPPSSNVIWVFSYTSDALCWNTGGHKILKK